MHSRIYQIEQEQIDKFNYITEKDLFEHEEFLGPIADYVDGDTDRNKDIEWLINSYKVYGLEYNKEEESLIFQKGFKEKYFNYRFNKFKELTNSINLIDFINISQKLYEIKTCIEEKFEFYVYTDGWLITLDDFVRRLTEDRKYFVGATIDYHA